MPRISKVAWPTAKLDYGYLFDIQNDEELLAWFENVRVPVAQEEFVDAVNSHEGGGKGGHATKGGTITFLAGLKGISLVEALGKLNFDMMSGMHRILADSGRIFVGGNGGYFGMMSELEILDTHMVDKFILPTEEVRIIQWPGGEHFYAKIGNQDVVVNGKQKWDTREEAEAAAKKFRRR